MDKHFTITIEDDQGTKEFNVHKMVKKIFIYSGIFLFILLFFSVGTVFYLNHSLTAIEKKKGTLEKAYKNLETKRQKTLEELSELSDSLSEIEKLIGLKPLGDESLSERVNSAKLTSSQRATLLRLLPSGSPVEYHGITSKFGYRIHPTLNTKEFHRGSDLKAKRNTPVYATADAIVEWAGFHKSSGFGYLVILTHVYGFKSYFGHLKKVVVKSGQFVKKGDLIAYSGNSGLSSGPHLHYEIRFFQRPLNPYYFMKWTQKNYNTIFQKEKKVPWKSIISAMKQIEIVTPKSVENETSAQKDQNKTIAEENNVTGKTL